LGVTSISKVFAGTFFTLMVKKDLSDFDKKFDFYYFVPNFQPEIHVYLVIFLKGK